MAAPPVRPPAAGRRPSARSASASPWLGPAGWRPRLFGFPAGARRRRTFAAPGRGTTGVPGCRAGGARLRENFRWPCRESAAGVQFAQFQPERPIVGLDAERRLEVADRVVRLAQGAARLAGQRMRRGVAGIVPQVLLPTWPARGRNRRCRSRSAVAAGLVRAGVGAEALNRGVRAAGLGFPGRGCRPARPDLRFPSSPRLRRRQRASRTEGRHPGCRSEQSDDQHQDDGEPSWRRSRGRRRRGVG